MVAGRGSRVSSRVSRVLKKSRVVKRLYYMNTVEPRFNEVAGDRPNLFVKWRVRYIEVLFHTFYCNFGRDIEIISFVISRVSLNRGSLNRGSTVTKNKIYTL